MGSIIEQGMHQAQQNDATVHALYVVDVRSYMMLPDDTAEHVARLLKEEGQRAICTLKQEAAERGVEFFGDVVIGVPHEAILVYVDEQDIDLIVMGTHGRTGERKRIVGSVTEEVIRRADIPVLVVPMSEVERQEVNGQIPDEQQRYVQ